MSISGHTPKLLEQKLEIKNVVLEEPVLTPRQQLKQDALELAEVIYDIYKDVLSNATIGDVSRKDDKNA